MRRRTRRRREIKFIGLFGDRGHRGPGGGGRGGGEEEEKEEEEE